MGTNPSRKNPIDSVAYRATRFHEIASAEILGLKTLLSLDACCPTALTAFSSFCFSSKKIYSDCPTNVK
jgi:hypothetical protein